MRFSIKKMVVGIEKLKKKKRKEVVFLSRIRDNTELFKSLWGEGIESELQRCYKIQ